MSKLTKLTAANSRKELATLLGFKPATLSYIVYKLPPTAKYYQFSIPKSSGGLRNISAPHPQLKLLQTRLADLLTDCLIEIERSEKKRKYLSHGFLPGRTIMTNANKHKRRRYVFNCDLQDFFPSLNFGRVRGYFLSDKKFSLHPEVATTIAQIACHDNSLPQGSPCSPIISCLVTNFLDIRLARLAKLHKCTYTRYADDITLSTNRKDFPTGLAVNDPVASSNWLVGKDLHDTITKSGFNLNDSKTRMQIHGSRQTVTGLIVNEKVNIRPEYYRSARAMCDRLFREGNFYRHIAAPLEGGPAGAPDALMPQSMAQLEGILNHIHFVKDSTDSRTKDERREKPTASTRLYYDFLFFKRFVALDMPLIIAEGPSDYIYLKEAIKALPSFQPKLGSNTPSGFRFSMGFLRYGQYTRNVMRLDGGSSSFVRLINTYERQSRHYDFSPFHHPVIILIDNDDGASGVFSAAKKHSKITPSLISTDPFYRLCLNLYLVKTPEKGKSGKSCIEDLFEPSLLKTKVDGKDFDPHKEHNEPGKYGKVVFAERVVKANAATVNFTDFSPFLDRISAVIDDYKAHPVI